MNATVKSLNSERGFGFARADDGIEYFFHYTALAGKQQAFATLVQGQKVTIEPDTARTDKGPRAASVSLV